MRAVIVACIVATAVGAPDGPVSAVAHSEQAAKAAHKTFDEGGRLKASVAVAQARLRGLQRRATDYTLQTQGVESSFQAMNKTLTNVLLPKLSIAEAREKHDTAEDNTATAKAAALRNHANDVAHQVLEARNNVEKGKKEIAEAEETMRRAAIERSEGDALTQQGQGTVSQLEQEMVYSHHVADGAESQVKDKHARAEESKESLHRFETISRIETDRVKQGSLRARTVAEHRAEENQAAILMAEEDIHILDGKLNKWRTDVQSKAVQASVLREQRRAQEDQHSRELESSHDAEMSKRGKEAEKEAQRTEASPAEDWAWDGDDPFAVDSNDSTSVDH